MGWQINAKGLRFTLNKIYDRYQIPLLMDKNGMGTHDVKAEDRTGALSRDRKDSFYWYQKVIATNGADLA